VSGTAGIAVPSVSLDACCFIYLVEGSATWRAAVEERLRAYPDSTLFVTSQLTRLECRVRPIRTGDSTLLGQYDAILAADRIRVANVDAATIDSATNIRAQFGFKTPDAIHLATTIVAGAEIFLTGDFRLQRCTDVTVEVIAG